MADRSLAEGVIAPAAPIAKTLKLRAADERLMLGLGSALVLHWEALPQSLQDLLIDQATIVLDDAGLPGAQHSVEALIRNAKAIPLAAKK
jgi:hypothetical protein